MAGVLAFEWNMCCGVQFSFLLSMRKACDQIKGVCFILRKTLALYLAD